MPHPEAMNALYAGAITAHFSSPPFQYQEVKRPGIRRVLSNYDILGGKATFNVNAPRVGTYTFIATYLPTGAFSGSTSASRTGTVNSGPTTVAINVPGEPLTQGQNAIVNVQLTSP